MESVIRYLETHQDRFISELIEYLRFPSVSAQPHHTPDLLACAHWLHDHCVSLGLHTELKPTPGNPVVVARTPHQPSKPHYVVYGHYDVQPPEPLELWNSPPFAPTLTGTSLVARGSSDNKGQHFAHLKAVEAYLKTGTPLPCNLTFVIEGEEEVGSNHLSEFLHENKEALQCSGVVISDSGIPDHQHPALTYSLRGIAAFEIKVIGPSRDLHSGIYGGSVDNPAMVLCQLLAQLRDASGQVTIPGFYQDVLELSDLERESLGRLPHDETDYRKFLGVDQTFGEAGYSSIEQRSARPTFEINGLTSGYQGVGSKTIIPSWASAKITMRLVPNQDPEKVMQQALNHLRHLCPPTVKLELSPGHTGQPYLVSPDSPQALAAMKALEKAFGYPPVLLREGGSIPIVVDFSQILGVETLLLGMALPEDNAHSPNEKFDLESFKRGMLLGAHLWPELAKV